MHSVCRRCPSVAGVGHQRSVVLKLRAVHLADGRHSAPAHHLCHEPQPQRTRTRCHGACDCVPCAPRLAREHDLSACAAAIAAGPLSRRPRRRPNGLSAASVSLLTSPVSTRSLSGDAVRPVCQAPTGKLPLLYSGAACVRLAACRPSRRRALMSRLRESNLTSLGKSRQVAEVRVLRSFSGRRGADLAIS